MSHLPLTGAEEVIFLSIDVATYCVPAHLQSEAKFTCGVQNELHNSRAKILSIMLSSSRLRMPLKVPTVHYANIRVMSKT